MTLRDLRRAVPMEQKELAEQIGVSTLTVSSWETGRRRPKAAHIRKLADILNVNMKELLFVLDSTKMAHDVTTDARQGARDSLSAPQGA